LVNVLVLVTVLSAEEEQEEGTLPIRRCGRREGRAASDDVDDDDVLREVKEEDREEEEGREGREGGHRDRTKTAADSHERKG